ncbi:MAG: nucleotidyltransferase, partial [Sphingobacteriales bacterium]
VAQVNNETNDEVYYELGRFVDLLLKNNPNMLELLATPASCILYRHELMDMLPMELFLSGLCRETFAGYAFTQVKKARGYKKKVVNPVEAERKNVLDFCFVPTGAGSVAAANWLAQNGYRQEQCGLTTIPHTKGMFALFYDAANSLGYRGIYSGPDANEVSLTSIPKGEQPLGYLYFNVESYSAYCREYREYWDWVAKRNEQRYLGNQLHGKDYDAKNMMPTIRLLQVAKEIAEEGRLNVVRSNRDELLAIKTGHYEYDELLTMADGLMNGITESYANSDLQALPAYSEATAALVQMRNILYRER